MKKENKAAQAMVVILVVGIGLLHNVDKKSYLFNRINPMSISLESNSDKSDSLEVKENNLFIYTTKIINSGIQHLISNL